VLRPNPPMTPGVLLIILGVVLAMNVAFGILFLMRGAWPVAPFMGADVALLAWAFRASHDAARGYEHVILTPSELTVARHPARGAGSKTVLNPYWVNVQLEQSEDMPRKLLLRTHGKTFQVGSFLGPGERRSFGEALKKALGCARAWRPA